MTVTYSSNCGGSLFTYTCKLVDQSVNYLPVSYHQHSDLPYFLVRLHISTVPQADEGGVAPSETMRVRTTQNEHVNILYCGEYMKR